MAQTGADEGKSATESGRLSSDERTELATQPASRGSAPAAPDLSAAVRVLDAFHVVKLDFDAVDQVRRRVQQDTFGHRGRAGDPLYGIRRVPSRGHDHHSDRCGRGPPEQTVRALLRPVTRRPQPGRLG